MPSNVGEIEVAWANELYFSGLGSGSSNTGLYRVDLTAATPVPSLIPITYPTSLSATGTGSVYFLRGTLVGGVAGTTLTSPVTINGFDLGELRAVDFSGPGDFLIAGRINNVPKVKVFSGAVTTVPADVVELHADIAGGYYAITQTGTSLNSTYRLVHATQATSTTWTELASISSVSKLTAAYGLDGNASHVVLVSGAVGAALTSTVVTLPVPIAFVE